MHPSIAQIEKLAYSVDEARAVAGMGRTMLYQCIANRSLRAKKCGDRTLILRDDLRDFLERLPTS